MTPEIFMDEEIDEPVILDNIIFANIEEKEISGSNEVMEVNKLNWAGKPGPPRQLLEVLPDKRNRNYSGSLKLKLKIDRSGKVADYVILFNSIDCEDCLKEIISAVYKSLWEPGIKNGLETEFWVEKSYTFN
ncbi:MAG: energy transducer TonB [Ignavibacteriaceae bacterium]|nr:energy transducer TonB [Ignavibacteriaceae bacterium]MCW9096426.1 energy transducer TonB [Ignavibacteriaceae bacterium]